jgi:heptosyltransferase-2
LKILVVKIGALGDAVMALSMLKAIDQTFPNAHITWLCGESIEPLIKAQPRINEIAVVNDRKLLTGGALASVRQLAPLWLKFFGKRFDLIVTGHSDSRYGWLSLTARAKTRRQFGRGAKGSWPVPGRYHAHEYVRLITGENGPDVSPGIVPTLQFQLPSFLSQKLVPSKKIVALAPGGAKNILRDDQLRRWPLENYVRLAEKLIGDGFQVLITGSQGDEWIQSAFKPLPVTDLVGQTSISELAALYGRSDLVITHDSGPLHLAVASGQKVIALFGPTVPWEKVPRLERVRVLWGGEKLACRPCYDGKNYADCDNNVCLQDLSVEKVYEEAGRALTAP